MSKLESVINVRLRSLIGSGLFATKRALAKSAGINEMTLNDNLRDKMPSFATLEAILKAVPTISAEWLMRGEGEMFRGADIKTGSGDNIITIDKSSRSVVGGGTIGDGNNASSPDLVAQLHRTVESLTEQLKAKDEQLKAKDEQLRAKDEQMATLFALIRK